MNRSICIFLNILLFSAVPNARGQDFTRWFDEGVMRVDLVFTGTGRETSYAFEALRREPFYSGSRTRLIEPFDYGDHQFEVRDAATGTLLFRHTYCTLFREWQTTTEAETG
jgi:hypothetical protein